ncbi:MAG: thioesterase family protein [Flavobacteriaceae bacterium]|nr:thioesterase family protein [Flavobacteriaceae bacterium]
MCSKKLTMRAQVHYHQVDQMGIVHHAQYAYFLEQARIQWLTDQGISYAALEKDGILLPLRDISIHYSQPLRFEDNFLVHLVLEKTTDYAIDFFYTIEREDGIKIATASTKLVYVDAVSRKAIKCPAVLQAIFQDK